MLNFFTVPYLFYNYVDPVWLVELLFGISLIRFMTLFFLLVSLTILYLFYLSGVILLDNYSDLLSFYWLVSEDKEVYCKWRQKMCFLGFEPTLFRPGFFLFQPAPLGDGFRLFHENTWLLLAKVGFFSKGLFFNRFCCYVVMLWKKKVCNGFRVGLHGLCYLIIVSLCSPALHWVAGEAHPLIPGLDGTDQASPP